MTNEELAQRLKLTRPLVFLDVETTQPTESAKPKADQDNIIQFAAVKLLPDGTTKQYQTLVKPGLTITAASTEHHKITNEMVAGQPIWRDVGPGIIKSLEGCDLAGYYVKGYDIPLIRAECKRHAIRELAPSSEIRIVDAYSIAATKERRDLAWALQFYTGQTLEGGHRADVDTAAVMQVLGGQLERYDDLPADVAAIHEWAFPVDPSWVDEDGRLQWVRGDVVITVTDQAGTPVRLLNDGLIKWFLKKDFSDRVKQVIRDIRAKRFTEQPPAGCE